MSKFHLISTFDYEIFGDGSGCLKHCLLDPIEQCLSISEKYQSPQTFFVDFLEFASFKSAAASSHALSKHYEQVEAQLKSFESSIHNVQWHLHPQWLDAKPNTTDWALDFEKWRIGDLNEADLTRAFEKGLAFAEAIGLTTPENNLKVFRAGGWAIQPADKVLNTLANLGVIIDSTVAPGVKNAAKGDWFNFAKAPNLPFWNIEADVCQATPNGKLIEAPITAQFIGRRAHIRALKEHRQHPTLPCHCDGTYHGPNNKWQSYRGKLSKILNIGRVMLDVSTLPAWALIEATERYMERFADSNNPIPLVAIGHNKNFTDQSARHFDDYLSWANNQKDIQFSDYTEWYSHIR